MKQTLLLLLLVLTFGLAPAPTQAANHPGSWHRLGQKEASRQLDHDEILVGAGEGSFRSIKLAVLKTDVEFFKVRVVYSSGADQNIELRSKIRAGGETRAIDLNSGRRSIRKVIFNYRTHKPARQRAVVVLFGRR